MAVRVRAGAAIATNGRARPPRRVAPGEPIATRSEAVPAVALHGVWAGYGRSMAIRDISLTVPRGATLALLGANGAGKSTVLRVISGLVSPTRGEVELAGEPLPVGAPWNVARAGVGHVPEGRGIFPGLSVARNLALARYATPPEAEHTFDVLSLFPILGDRPGQLAGTLSGGQQQMLAIARVLAASPSVVLCDELSLGLAPSLVKELFGVVRTISASGTTVILVEQFVSEALELADLVAVLARGRLVFFGEPGELRDGDATDLLDHYMGKA